MKELREEVTEIVAMVTKWFISTAFIMWGWNTLTPHIDCPTFGYWEMFAMRMGFSYLTDIIGYNLLRDRD